MSGLRTSIHALVLVAVLACACATAATEQWTYSGLTGIFQIVADGAGGCAMTRYAGAFDDSSDVVWLNKKGALIYQAGISNVLRGGIMVCTPKNLVYADMRDTNMVVHVAADGTATIVPAAAHTLNRTPLPYPIYWQLMADSKGFFATRTDTNTMAATLVRYSNK
ncbi:MAG: hypothetical protein NTV22_19970 [bacterium]|nr:hypothetical protein [bacterium]